MGDIADIAGFVVIIVIFTVCFAVNVQEWVFDLHLLLDSRVGKLKFFNFYLVLDWPLFQNLFEVVGLGFQLLVQFFGKRMLVFNDVIEVLLV